MNKKLHKLAGLLALVIGGMAVFAGSKVLIGIDPGYQVVNWLPLYNYTAGIVTIVITAALLWRNSRLAMPAALATFSAHAVVMAILQTGYRSSVASESIQAMTLRMIIWIVILGMLFLGARMGGGEKGSNSPAMLR